MQFNSIVFLLFLLLFLTAWRWVLERRQARFLLLTAASFFFYGWWDWRFIFLLAANGLIDFFVALAMARQPVWRRTLLVASILGNVGCLATFKYMGFLTTTLDSALRAMGAEGGVPIVELALPIGISFYTFQSMSYTIEVYRGQLKPTPNPLHYFAFLAMFPQLVAGPIVRASALLPQLEDTRPPSEEQRWSGLRLIVEGYFKKVVIADNLAPAVNLAFGQGTTVESGAFWWIVTTCFALQIYCDFSGYSDIARGVARCMGYELGDNFDHPYAAHSLRNFWQRWHISLSTWFRDYLYFPLGGSRDGRGHRNMWITMVVSGLWHGAAWRFVLWGALHAAFLSLERLTDWPRRLTSLPLGGIATRLLVLLQVWLAWVFFRADSAGHAFEIVGVMLDPRRFSFVPGCEVGFVPLVALGVISAWEGAIALWGDPGTWFRPRLRAALGPVVLSLMVVACVYLRGPGNTFIYFQF